MRTPEQKRQLAALIWTDNGRDGFDVTLGKAAFFGGLSVAVLHRWGSARNGEAARGGVWGDERDTANYFYDFALFASKYDRPRRQGYVVTKRAAKAAIEACFLAFLERGGLTIIDREPSA